MSWHVAYHYKKSSVSIVDEWDLIRYIKISIYPRIIDIYEIGKIVRNTQSINVHISDLYIQKKLLGAVECKNTVYDIFHYRGPSLRRIYTWMSYKNTVTVLRVFAIKPMIIIAWRLVHSFCVFHKKFNGQQFFQEALDNNYPMTNKIHSK